jgi:hypothetical protein
MTPAADRQRRYRQRRKAGKRCFLIEVDEAELAIALEESGVMGPLDADDNESVSEALNEMIRIIARNA